MHFFRSFVLFALCPAGLSSLAADDVWISSPPHQWQTLHAPFDTWVTMTFEAKNPHVGANEAFLTSYFEDQSQQQFGRRFWIPPESVLKSWYLAKTLRADANSVEQNTKRLS